MIELKNIHIAYDRDLLNNETMIIPSSQITLISGDSGSGKSALLYRIGLITRDCHISYDGQLIENNNVEEIRRDIIGFVLQDCDIIDHLSVKDNLSHYALMINKHLDDEEIQRKLDDVRLDAPLNQSCLTLSLGQRQRLAIACTLIKDPQVLILDEPTASLDDENEIIIFDILKHLAHDSNKTIVLASHSEKAIEYADRIYSIQNQTLVLSMEKPYQEVQHPVQKKKINKYFYKTYTKHFFKKYKTKYILLSLVMFIILMLSCIGFTLTDSIIQHNKDILYSSFDKILYITKDKASCYAKDNMTMYGYPNLQSNEHPYIKMTLAQEDSIYIVPYFDNQDFEDRLISYNKTDDKHGIYISRDAKKMMSRYYGDYGTNITLSVNIYDNYQMIEKKINTNILGFIKPGVYEYYNNKNTQFIYMYYEDIEKVYKGDQYIGFVAEFDNYNDLKKAKEDYINKGYMVNDTFIDIEAIDEIVNFYTNIEKIFIVVLFIIAIIVIVLLNLNLYWRRKRELAILLLNGVPSSVLVKIAGYEYIIQMKYPFIIYLITHILLIIFFKGNISLLVYPMMFIMIAFIILLILSYCFVKHLNIEKSLRNS